MEATSLSFALDVIGLAVFNYDFGSITTESPIIQSVYSVLKVQDSARRRIYACIHLFKSLAF